MTDDTLAPAQRRRFLAIMLGGVGSALGAMTLWPLLRFFSPGGGGDAAVKIGVPRDKVALNGAYLFDFRGRPAVLLQPKPGEYVALTAVCTHLGCIVKWVAEKQEFLCPCHGGRFSGEGAVLGGPPPADLENYPVTLEGDQLLVG